MKKLRLLILVQVLVLIGCNRTPPFDAFVAADNSNFSTGDQNYNSLCVGGLRARLSVADLTVEVPTVPQSESRDINYLMPARVGTPVTVEAWCYGRDNAEIGYTRVTAPYTNTNIPTISARAPQTPELALETCVRTAEVRGLEICISSSMFD